MKIIDSDEFFIQVCRTHDEFIDLGELAELLDKAPTVEAISVEWLKEKAQEFAERYWDKKDDHKKLILPMADCPVVIEQMIKEWKVENGTENN